MSERYKLVSIVDLDVEAQMKVLDIRNQLGVRKWMYSDHIISADEHAKWIDRLKTCATQQAFAIIKDKSSPLIVGLVGVNNIDATHKKASRAFYLEEAFQGRGLGAAIEYSTLNYCFNDLKLDKLNCEVIEGNNLTLKLHDKFSFQNEGFLRYNIIKKWQTHRRTFIGYHKRGVERGSRSHRKQIRRFIRKI